MKKFSVGGERGFDINGQRPRVFSIQPHLADLPGLSCKNLLEESVESWVISLGHEHIEKLV